MRKTGLNVVAQDAAFVLIYLQVLRAMVVQFGRMKFKGDVGPMNQWDQ